VDLVFRKGIGKKSIIFALQVVEASRVQEVQALTDCTVQHRIDLFSGQRRKDSPPSGHLFRIGFPGEERFQQIKKTQTYPE